MTTDVSAVLDVARTRIAAEAAGVARVEEQLGDSFVLAARLLFGCRGKVFVSGSGTSGTIARRMAHLFAVTGTPSIFLPAMDALHGTLGAATEGDLLIVISKGGGSDEINDLVTRCKDRGAGAIAITCTNGTRLTDNADLALVVDIADDLDLGGLVAMGSTLAHAVLGDALATVLMRAREYSWESVHHSHPGGAVGALTDLPAPVDRVTLEPLSLADYRAGER